MCKAMEQKQLYDALEFCLQAIEQGRDIESALMEYPHLSQTLRPLLEASLQARTWGGSPVPEQALERGRSKMLKRLEEIQNEDECEKKDLSIPAIVDSIKHTWDSIRSPLFINSHDNLTSADQKKESQLDTKDNSLPVNDTNKDPASTHPPFPPAKIK